MSSILDQFRPSLMHRWDTGSLGWVVWDGSLTTGALTVGAVTQGTGSTSAWLVKQTCATATLSNVSSSASSVTALASNASRLQATFANDSTTTCYLKFGSTASATSYTVKLNPGDYYELPMPIYTGIIDVIWASANGTLRVTELTA